MRVPVGRTSPHDLTHRPRASGPHDFSVRAHLRWVLHGWRALTVEAIRGRCQRRVVPRLPLLTVSRPAAPSRADAVAATASLPASRDDRETPLGGPGCTTYTRYPKFGKEECFCAEGLTRCFARRLTARIRAGVPSDGVRRTSAASSSASAYRVWWCRAIHPRSLSAARSASATR